MPLPPPFESSLSRATESMSMALAAGAIVGTWLWDVPRDQLTVDESLARAFGMDPALAGRQLALDEVLGLVHPDDQPGLSAAIARSVAEGGRFSHQYRARGTDGDYRWLEGIGRVHLDEQGRAARFPGVLIDIDERVRAEAERDQVQALLRSFIESVPGVMYAKDRQGRLLIGNQGTSDLLGLAPEQYVGRTDAELLADPQQAAAVMATDARIMASGHGEQVEEQVSFPDGTRAWWLSTKAPLRDAHGEVVGLVGTSLDITDRRSAEEDRTEIAERYRLAAQATNDAVWDWRIIDGQVIWNEAMASLFGHARTETSAQWWLQQIHPDDRARIEQGIHAVIDGGGSHWSSEYRFRRADGSHATVLDRGTVLRGPDGTPLRMIGAMLDLTGRKAAEAALQQSEERVRLATEAAELGFWDLDPVHDRLIWSSRTKAMFGLPPDASVTFDDFRHGLHPEDRQPTLDALRDAADPALRTGYEVEYRVVDPHGGPLRWLAAKGRGMFEHGRCVRLLGVVIDITARKQADAELKELNERLEARVRSEVAERMRVEDALRQSRKMEAVGQLTGGIAHDFNNMLATVIGPLDLLAMHLGDAEPRIRRYIDMALDGAQRAAQLTQRLLAFSRQQPLQPVPLDSNRLLAGMSDLLVHALGSSVRLETVLGADLWWIHADANQLENVILNLAVNARDAMPDGGQLRLETGNCVVEADADAGAPVPAGEYVRITVTDTGHGMAEEVMAKAFDPFFTTKQVGQGTGLGLSQVYGFLQQSDGHVILESAPGRGTTVRVYLPRLHGADLPSPAAAPAPRDAAGGREQVLVVDDDAGVRQFSIDALEALGYQVLSADGGDSALRVLQQHASVDLLFTDVVMPHMNGRQLADRAHALRPGLKVLFATGNSRNALVDDGVLDPRIHLLGKPFTVVELAERVRTALAN